MKKDWSKHIKNVKRFCKRSGKQFLARLIHMFKPFERIYIKSEEPDLIRGGVIRSFGKIVGLYEERDGKKYLIETKKFRADDMVFYLKVDRIASYTMMCIQHWICVADAYGARICFVCDNKNLEKMIIKECTFQKLSDINFIKSIKKPTKEVVKQLYTGYWKNVTYAQLTPFYHAKEHKIERFFTIDADDTSFLMPPDKVAAGLKEAAKFAVLDEIQAFSLDMHCSRTRGKYWSFGVAFINGTKSFTRIFEENKDRSWIEKLSRLQNFRLRIANVDHFFCYLKETGLAKIESFYLDKSSFVHWEDPSSGIVPVAVMNWENRNLTFVTFQSVPQKNLEVVYPITNCRRIIIKENEEMDQL